MKIITELENIKQLKAHDFVQLQCYCCDVLFYKEKQYVSRELKFNLGQNKYCSLKCFNKLKNTQKLCKCAKCDKEIYKTQKVLNETKSGNVFCSQSCAADFNNKNRSQFILDKISHSNKNKTIEEKNEILNKRQNTLIKNYGSLEEAYKIIIPKLNEKERKKQIASIKKHWEEHPEKRKKYSIIAKNRVFSEETRKKLSDSIKKRIKEGKHKGWASRNNPSYPENFFMKVLINNSIEYDFESSCGKYFIDFALKNKKIALEIDGQQHKQEDIKKKDKEKDLFLKLENWFVYRIEWNNINSLTGKEIMKEKIEKFIEFYNNF